MRCTFPIAVAFDNADGQFGLPSHGSVTIRWPDGSPRMNVEWPSHLIDKGIVSNLLMAEGRRRDWPIIVSMSGVAPLQIIRGGPVKDGEIARTPKPDWLKVRAPGSPNYLRLRSIMRDLKLHTVCEEAHCPNIGECWHHGTATFMIMGDVCTRACTYCAVAHGRPATLDLDEPRRVADAIEKMG